MQKLDQEHRENENTNSVRITNRYFYVIKNEEFIDSVVFYVAATKNLYKLYCSHCDRTQPKISRKDKKECVVCHEKFQFQCLKCCKRYNNYIGIYIHLKSEYMKNSGFERSDKQLRFSSKGCLSVDLETNKNVQNFENSELCFNCGIATNKLTNQTELCKAPKSFTCSACSFKCCSKNNLKYHMQYNHKISINYVATSDSNEKEMSNY